MRCAQTSLAGTRCVRRANHRPDHEFLPQPTATLVETINWALADEVARLRAELAIERTRVVAS